MLLLSIFVDIQFLIQARIDVVRFLPYNSSPDLLMELLLFQTSTIRPGTYALRVFDFPLSTPMTSNNNLFLVIRRTLSQTVCGKAFCP